jgi:hypothetical protein
MTGIKEGFICLKIGIQTEIAKNVGDATIVPKPVRNIRSMNRLSLQKHSQEH